MNFGFFYTLSCPPVNHQGNVEFQGVLSKQTLDTLSTQSVQTHYVLAELNRQNALAARDAAL